MRATSVQTVDVGMSAGSCCVPKLRQEQNIRFKPVIWPGAQKLSLSPRVLSKVCL